MRGLGWADGGCPGTFASVVMGGTDSKTTQSNPRLGPLGNLKLRGRNAEYRRMRPAGLIGLVVSLVLAAVAVAVTNGDAASQLGNQDRSLQAAVSTEQTLVTTASRQTATAASLLLVDPAMDALLGADGTLPATTRRSDVAETDQALAALERAAELPLSGVCLDSPSGQQLACDSSSATAHFPNTLGRKFAADLTSSRTGVLSGPFASPTGHQAVAFVLPLRAQGRLLGLVHLDLASSEWAAPQVLAAGGKDLRVQVTPYHRDELQLGGLFGPGAPAGARTKLRLANRRVRVSATAALLTDGGHRTMVKALPITFGASHAGVAVVATALASAPAFLSAWRAPMIMLLVFAILLLLVSLAAMAASYRKVSRELARDPLTGLRNRRRLMVDLERTCRAASRREPARLWFFDLNGFKRYNEAFGRVAGDTMLERLAERLSDTVEAYGQAYRVGGDEFCVLTHAQLEYPEALLADAREALTERGGAFDITPAAGSVSLPLDANEPAHALLLADQRMYHAKVTKRADATGLVTAVLHAALAQRHPDLGDHADEVADQVAAVARAVGLGQEALEVIVAAADLHDIGKLGVPDEIIRKPGPLDEHEWEFIKQHTLIGERIILAAGLPMEGVGQLVRSSHERWDGSGYPDGLSGDEIPLGARIIAICDAFDAMTEDRVYQRARSLEGAMSELQRCAGSQFDPVLVNVFCRVLRDRTASPERLGEAVA